MNRGKYLTICGFMTVMIAVGCGTDMAVPVHAEKKESVESTAAAAQKKAQTLYTTAGVNVRADCQAGSEIVGGLAKGQEVQATGVRKNGWTQVLYGGSKRYIYSDYLTEKKPQQTENNGEAGIEATDQKMYTTAPLNVREGSSTDTDIIGSLQKWKAVHATGFTDNGWVRIEYDGQVGYVYGDYLSAEYPAPNNPPSDEGYDDWLKEHGGKSEPSVEGTDETMYALAPVNVRDGAGTDAAVIGVVGQWMSVHATGYTDNGWVRIDYDDQDGYVYGDYVSTERPATYNPPSDEGYDDWLKEHGKEPIPSVEGTDETMYALGPVNVRDGAGTDAEVIGVVGQWMSVHATGYADNGWVRIDYEGQDGYVYGDYLSTERPETYNPPSDEGYDEWLEEHGK